MKIEKSDLKYSTVTKEPVYWNDQSQLFLSVEELFEAQNDVLMQCKMDASIGLCKTLLMNYLLQV